MLSKNFKRFMIIVFALVFVLPYVALFYEANSMDRWLEIFQTKRIYTASMATVKIAGLTLLMNFAVGIPAASILHRREYWFVRAINGFLYLPLIIPGLIITLGIHFTFIKIGIVETLFGVVLVHSVVTLPYFIKAVVAGYHTIDSNYYNLSRIIGMSRLQGYIHITLPKLFPSLIVGSSLVVIVSFAQYVTTLIIGGGKIITLPIIIYPYISGGNFRMSSILSIIFVTVNFVLIFSFEKFMKKIYVTGEE